MKNIIKIISLLTLVFILSCEKDANIPVPESKPKLTIANFLCPNEDTVVLKLTWSAPVYYSSKKNLSVEKNAEVILKSNNKSYKLTYHDDVEAYFSTIPKFNSGDKIELSVKVDNHSIKSSCTIPDVPKFNVSIDKPTKLIDETGYQYYKYIVHFTAKNNSKNNRYRLLFTKKENIGQIVVETPVLSEGLFVELGKNKEKLLELFAYDENPLKSLNIYIIHCDEHYFLFHRSVVNAQPRGIFSEPTIVYSNIEGGLGGFGAYNMVKKAIVIK